MSKNAVIIVAAGTGSRMKSDIAKQYLMLNEKRILNYTIESFENCKSIDDIVLVVGSADLEFVSKEIVGNSYSKIKAIVAGGSERQNSVYNGITALDSDTDIVLVHDGVRPFVLKEDIEKIITATKEYSGCVMAVKVKDTIKIADERGYVADTPKRENLWAAQTPQCFSYDILKMAYEKAFAENFLGTDDSMLVERAGYKIKLIEGSYDNIKITTPEDLYIGENILQRRK